MAQALNGSSVLFVDDDHLIRDLFGRAFNAAGMENDIAADGNKALENLGKRQYDAVVIDMIMPEREGVETIREIRKRWPKTFIVAISGGGRIAASGFLDIAQAIGADRTLAKPFTPNKLFALLGEGRQTMAYA